VPNVDLLDSLENGLGANHPIIVLTCSSDYAHYANGPERSHEHSGSSFEL